MLELLPVSMENCIIIFPIFDFIFKKDFHFFQIVDCYLNKKKKKTNYQVIRKSSYYMIKLKALIQFFKDDKSIFWISKKKKNNLIFLDHEPGVYYNLLLQTLAWSYWFFELIDLGHRSSIDLIVLACYCVQLSQTLCVKPSWLMVEEHCTTKEIGSITPASIRLGWNHCYQLCLLSYPLMERNRPSFHDASTCFVPTIYKANDAFLTSRNLLIVTISKLPNFFADVSLWPYHLPLWLIRPIFLRVIFVSNI